MTYEAFYKRMKAFDSHYYCIFNGMHPKELLNLDNNLEIAFFMRNGKRIKDLRSMGIDFKHSQIRLLKSYDLIREDKGIFYSNVLFFPEFEAMQLRKFADDMAVKIAASLSGEIKSLVRILEKEGMGKNAFSILFSYVLDSQVWDCLVNHGEIPRLKVGGKNPHWCGLAWMIEPKKPISLGTNFFSSGNASLCCTTSSQRPKLKPDGEIIMSKIADDFRAHGKTNNETVVRHMEEMGLMSKGKLLIPVIKTDIKDPVFKASKLISVKITEFIRSNSGLIGEIESLADLDRWKRLIIIYHEIMWGIMDILIMAGEVEKPTVLTDKKSKDLSELMYVTIK